MSILKFSPDHDIAEAEAAMKLQAWPEAIGHWQKILKKYKRRTPPLVYVRLSTAYRRQANYEDAESIVKRGIELHPNYLALHVERAEIATYGLDRSEAISRWKAIIDKFGDGAPTRAWIKLSRLYRQEQKLNDAERIVKQGLSRYPDSTDLSIEAAKVAAMREEWPKAIRRWQAAIDGSDGSAPIEAWLGLSRAQRKKGKLKEAEVTAERGLSENSMDFKLRLESAEIAMAKRDWVMALDRWQFLLDKFDGSPVLDTSLRPYVRFNVSILKRLIGIEDYKKQIAARSKSNKRKIVIYTSVTKGYDTLKPPEIVDSRFDYVVYADSQLDGMGIYDVRPLPEPNHDNARAIRYPKTHPHKLFKDYDIAIWLDTSLMIVDDIYPIIEKFIKSGQAIGSSPHSVRKSVYEEFEACLALKKDDPKIINRQMEYYKGLGFENNDLTENGFLAFNLKHKSLAPAMEAWWQQILNFSKRDQLSFNFALSQNKVEWYPLTRAPHGLYNHPAFVLTPHNSEYKILHELVDLLAQNKQK